MRFRDARDGARMWTALGDAVHLKESRRRIFKLNVLDDENDERWGKYAHGVSRYCEIPMQTLDAFRASGKCPGLRQFTHALVDRRLRLKVPEARWSLVFAVAVKGTSDRSSDGRNFSWRNLVRPDMNSLPASVRDRREG